MAYADEKASIELRIAKIQRYIDWQEGVNSNTYGPYGENYDGMSGTPDADDTEAAAHRWTGTGGGNAYWAWWRSQNPTADATSTGANARQTELIRDCYREWKLWSDNGSDVAAETGASAALTKMKSDIAALKADRDQLQDRIDNDAPSIAL